MNTDELSFAYTVRHALNENLDNLPESTTKKLAAARKIALSRKRKESVFRSLLVQPRFAGRQFGGFFREPHLWLGRMGLALPVIVLVAGLTGIYQVEQQKRISEIAELDAAVLSDELPLSAYLDNGFNAFLADRGD
ncbi:MAG TPA: DUF3619 family protein [Noviherbaspirillum sp.]|jgi:hypothetical protein|uniref:DUF3619 family protein n=1 Tax=Noviherbaspirillum sp. TaxID=1926288 RepID=UPI002DDD36E2|nr:DUF3619 family protein [Noviherbaspirillum sp.]HEV2612414.1 DUF3619 family protein [Noviherbaspirillum sp.]